MKYLLFILGFLFLFLPDPAQAISSFTTNYQITYQVEETGVTKVTYEIDQINNLSSVYATDFSLSVSETDLMDIVVEDSGMGVTPEIQKTQNLTNISFTFPQKVVGKGEHHNFSISYRTNDIAMKVGSVWEINIPHLVTNEMSGEVNISLTVPDSFSQPAYVFPKPYKTETNTYHFNSASLANRSISAVFGKQQFFSFSLFYNLSNNGSSTNTTNITLPPNTPYQEVYYTLIDPKPEKIESDQDGNWIATIKLPPQNEVQVRADGIVRIGLNPKTFPLSNPSKYTSSTSLWPTQDVNIRSIASDLPNAESIYQYVYDHLSYNYARLTKSEARLGALHILKNPDQAICTDFTDLFIALARSNQIPSRELEGYAFSTNDKLRPLSLSQDVLHAWPEYYDFEKKTWIQIDPTWANTTQGIDYFNKLDLNHFVFAIHGTDPFSPPPAGAYKNKLTKSKDVFVKATEETPFPKPELKFQIVSRTPDSLDIQISNLSGVGLFSEVHFSDPSVSLDHKTAISLPAFGNQTISLPIANRLHLKSIQSTINISYDGQNFTLPVVYDASVNQYLLYLGVAFLALSATLIARYLHLRRQTRTAPIHW